MGWEDAPTVDSAPAGQAASGWAAAPVVGAAASPGQKSPTPIPPRPPETMLESMKKNPLGEMAGMYLEPPAALISGMAAGPAAGISGLFGSATPGEEGQGPRRAAAVADTLTYQPKTTAGKAIVGGVAAPFEWLARKADRAGQKVSDLTGSPMLGTATNTGVQSIPAVLGKVLPRIAKPIAAMQQEKRMSPAAQREAALEAKRSEGMRAAQDAGYVVSPAEAGKSAGPVTKAVESLAGEPRTAKLASKKNQEITNDLIRKDVGLPENTPVTRDTLAAKRKELGQAYEDLRKAGSVTADEAYRADLKAIKEKFTNIEKDFPEMAKSEVTGMVDSLNKAQFSASSAVDLLKILREKADKAYRTGDGGLGKAYRQAAEAVENQMGRHLEKAALTGDMSGDPAVMAMLENFRKARTGIAKTYAADAALNDATGNINAGAYGTRYAKGKPLSGEGEQVGKFSAQFPKSSQRAEKLGATGATMGDAALALFGGKGGVADLALMGARPLARGALTSPTFQRAMMKPHNPNGATLATQLQDPAMQKALALAGVTGTAESANGR